MNDQPSILQGFNTEAVDEPAVAASRRDAMVMRANALRDMASEQRNDIVQRSIKFADDAVRSIASGMTFGFADEFAALMDSFVNNSSFSDEIAIQRARNKKIDPTVGFVGEVGGSIPVSIATAGLINPATAGIARAIKFAALGATEGLLSGFGHAEGDVVERAGSAAVGAGVGAVTGAVAPVIADKVIGLVQAIKRGKTISAAQRAAADKIGRAMEADEITPAQAMEELRKLGSDAMLADVAGENVRGVARAVTGTPGPSRTIARKALDQRQEGARSKVNAAIVGSTSDENAVAVRTAILERRRNDAIPLYEEAFSQGVVRNRTIEGLVEKSDDIKRAIAQARGIPEYADLPDYHMILLDKAYKNLGGKVSAAFRSGDNVVAHDLGNLKDELRKALIYATHRGDGTSPYQEALEKFHGESDLLRALDRGRKLLREAEPEVLVSDLRKMSEGEREMFLVGAARSMREAIDRAPDGVDFAKKLFGNPAYRERIRTALPDKSTYDDFAKEMMRQARFAETRRTMLSGSMTQPRQAEAADLLGEAANFARGDLPGLLYGLARMARGGPRQAPREFGEALFSADQAKNMDFLRLIENEASQRRISRPTAGALTGFGAAAGGLYGRE